MYSTEKPAQKPKRIVFHSAVGACTTFGLLLIALGILGIPQLAFLTGRMAASFGALSSAVLVLAGIVWLLGAGLFLYFFDSYLSRN
jgi:hypothetical protein